MTKSSPLTLITAAAGAATLVGSVLIMAAAVFFPGCQPCPPCDCSGSEAGELDR